MIPVEVADMRMKRYCYYYTSLRGVLIDIGNTNSVSSKPIALTNIRALFIITFIYFILYLKGPTESSFTNLLVESQGHSFNVAVESITGYFILGTNVWIISLHYMTNDSCWSCRYENEKVLLLLHLVMRCNTAMTMRYMGYSNSVSSKPIATTNLRMPLFIIIVIYSVLWI